MSRPQSHTLSVARQYAKTPSSCAVFKLKPVTCAVHAALLGVIVATGGIVPVATVYAQELSSDQVRQKTYALPPGPLGRVLSSFAAESGILLSFDPKLTEGIDTQGLTGNYSTEEGFAVLLSGTDLAYRFTSANTVTLERTAARREEDPNAITTLPSVTVSAERDDNLDVDEGFKADFQTSATKTPLSIRETPQSISVITRESIETRQARDLGSALELSAGTAVVGASGGPFAGFGRFARETVVLRGQVLDEGRDVRIDGFAVGGESLVDLALFERVEVVKGPSSVLYGPGSLSGFINRVSKKPQAERAASVVGQIGSFDTYRTEFDITGALDANERFAGRLIGVYEDSGSFTDGVDLQRSLIAPSFEARLGERTRVLVQGFLQDDSGTPSVGIPLIVEANGELRAPDIARSRYIGVPRNSEIETDQQQVSVRVDHEISDSWLTTLQLQNGRSRRATRFDNYGYGFYAGGDTYLYSAAGRAAADFWAGELRIDGEFNLLGREHRLLLGVESRAVDRSFGNSYVDIGVANIYEDNFDEFDSVAISTPIKSTLDTVTEAAYGQFIFGLSERTRLIAGLRYDRAEQRNRDNLEQSEPSDERAENDEITYRLALSQDLTANLSGFASYSTSFVPVVARSRSGAVLDPAEPGSHGEPQWLRFLLHILCPGGGALPQWRRAGSRNRRGPGTGRKGGMVLAASQYLADRVPAGARQGAACGPVARG